MKKDFNKFNKCNFNFQFNLINLNLDSPIFNLVIQFIKFIIPFQL